ncbi:MULTISPECIES: cation diffusion facilitator family transporter [Cytophagales]|jgi:divalent metal cation (Fe/Co/Zn/Cd) transporter|uniref:cation diffusion facilitator family transporter n=1 Tax=Cytophagales TaxID=768507 RepID=UPI0021D36EAA|nr:MULTISPECIES: cation transporter [Cytophagales]|tara:strand:+ start:1011 stop:1340 length:330 start_codon:yes stop_codon:yes gene_type:complete
MTKELLYRYLPKMRTEINSRAIKADAFLHRSDAITSAAAFIGISIAVIGGEGYEVADDFAALLAGGFVIYNAYGIARPATGELLDEALEPGLQEEIARIEENVNAVQHE